jgi:poly-beta-hydroxybutyrate-responsive repressor
MVSGLVDAARVDTYMQNAFKCQPVFGVERGMASGTKGKGSQGDGAGDAPRLPGEMLTAHLLAMLKDWSGYGYELAQRLEEAGFGRYNTGSLYRMLRQMEGLGLISSLWDTSAGGPARRMYSLTRAGRLFLDNWMALLDFHRRTLDAFVGAAQAPTRRADKDAKASTRPPAARRARPRKPKTGDDHE